MQTSFADAVPPPSATWPDNLPRAAAWSPNIRVVALATHSVNVSTGRRHLAGPQRPA